MTYQYSKDDVDVYLCQCGRYVIGLPEHFKNATSCGGMSKEHYTWLIHTHHLKVQMDKKQERK